MGGNLTSCLWCERDKVRTWIRSLDEADSVLALCREEQRLFLETPGQCIFARYRWGGEWRVARIRSVDPNGTVTVVWDDGFLQVGTLRSEARRMSWKVARSVPVRAAQPQVVPRPAYTASDTIFDLAKRGDVHGVLEAIDSGQATANDVQEIDGLAGRSVLYWACHGGHADLVAALLVRGAWDWDRSCAIAVTSNELADDARDLLFDPDQNQFSDFVDYAPRQSNKGPSSFDLIRSLLRDAAKNEPGRLFRSAPDECCVCAIKPPNAVCCPCGHVACCDTCLEQLRDRRQGCPICRARICRILPVAGRIHRKPAPKDDAP